MKRLVLLGLAACGAPAVHFPDRAPFTQDTDLQAVDVSCRPDPSDKDPQQVACFPKPYESPFVWDKVDNIAFGRFSRGLRIDVNAEAVNANSLDEVADSAWFENRPARSLEELAKGACAKADLIAIDDATTWTVDHGKDNGSTLGFRVDLGEHGKYLLKADETQAPERASAASVIGAAIYEALGFRSTCEQVVYFDPSRLKLKPGLQVTSNLGIVSDFDDAALKAIVDTLPRHGALVRMQASQWLEKPVLGPFRYEGTRDDDPNDVIPHENRRELRGSRVIAAWLNHWDAREQNTLDVWEAANAKEPRSSPGHVEHYIIDTSDIFGERAVPDTLERRMGFSYVVDWRDMSIDFVTLGLRQSPWDRARVDPKAPLFGYFSTRDFDPGDWKPAYPNPAFLRMTERDAAWMARRIARITQPELAAIVKAGQLSRPSDAAYIEATLAERQRRILARYLTRLSPLTDVTVRDDGQLCVIDLARYRGVYPEGAFVYRARQGATSLAVTAGADGALCVTPAAATGAVQIRIWNGTHAGPLDVYAYADAQHPLHVVGLRRPEP